MEAGLAIGGVAVGNTMAGAFTATADCGCCGEQPPPHTDCGRRYVVCMGRIRFLQDFVQESRRVTDGVLLLSLHQRLEINMIGGPYRLDPVIGPDQIQTLACGQVFYGDVSEASQLRCNTLPVPLNRSFRQMCGQVCVSCVEDEGQSPDLPPTVRFPAGTEIVGIAPVSPLVFPTSTGGTDTLLSGNPNGWGSTVFRRTETHGTTTAVATVTSSNEGGYRFGPGTNTYGFTQRSDIAGQTWVDCGVFGPAYVLVNTVGSILKVTDLEWVVTTTEEDDGTTHPPPSCGTPTVCEQPNPYIVGEPCPGSVGAPQVVWPAQNVLVCGTVPVGNFCYTVRPNGPRIVTSQTPPLVDSNVIDSNSPYAGSDCCRCQTNCPRTVLEPSPCWQNARRINGVFYTSNDRPDLVSPPFISGVCCCRNDDIISIAEASSDVTFEDGNVQTWRICNGPWTFRRDQAFPFANLACGDRPGDGTLFSNIHESLINFDYRQSWGSEFTNLDPMECEWTSLPPIIDFRNPQNAIGFFNNASQLLLPCPADAGGELNGWRIVQQDISVTCDTFLFECRYERVDSGTGAVVNTAYNRLLVRIARNPNTTGQPCTGGCAGSGGGSIITGQGVVGRSGCSTCGKDGL